MDSGDCETEEDSAPEACVSPEGPLMPSNSREMRNKAEKQRRDRLNSFINELATLVPMVSRSSKKMDKTSILRLAAVYLRLYQIDTVMDRNQCFYDLPKFLDQGVLEQLICDQFNGFILIVTASGRIVFASPTVEHLLGHLQTDLMGQSLFNITSPDDHEKLRTFLRSDFTNCEFHYNWKRYFNLNLKRAGPRSEQPVFEPVKFMSINNNILNNGPRSSAGTSPSSSCSSTNSSRDITSTFNDYLAFFVQINRPEPVIERLIESSKDEYKTRHLIDGRIISCDQRISLIAGYMMDEVSGVSAFKYMHRDDVRWVMIALRQMYDRRETRGSSCYRLLSRNGQFIYLRTYGYLEIDDQGTVESFVCINTLVSDAEGLHLINEMKKRYSALINSSNIGILTPPPSNESIDLVEDPNKVEQAVIHLIRDLPSPGSDNRSTPSPKIYNESQDCSSTTDSYSSSTTSTHKPYKYKTMHAKRPPRTDINTNVNSNKRRKTSSESSPQPLSPTRSLSPFSRRSPGSDITTSSEKSLHQQHEHLLQQHNF